MQSDWNYLKKTIQDVPNITLNLSQEVVKGKNQQGRGHSTSIFIIIIIIIAERGKQLMKISKEKMQLAMANACMNTTQLSKKADISRFSLNAYANKTRNPKPATGQLLNRLSLVQQLQWESMQQLC